MNSDHHVRTANEADNKGATRFKIVIRFFQKLCTSISLAALDLVIFYKGADRVSAAN